MLSGLPHAHILLILHDKDKPKTIRDFDRIVCAEIPNKNDSPLLYETVTTSMIHNPCHINKSYSCFDKLKNQCTKQFPKTFCEETINSINGYPIYRRRNDRNTVVVNNIEVDNRSVVPYNPFLSTKFNAHINVEICNSVLAVKYLYKYVYKGHKCIAQFTVSNNNENGHDEISKYLDARYVSASESCWRIFSFDLHSIKPSVCRLAIHLPGQNLVTFNDFDYIEQLIEKNCNTTLTGCIFYLLSFF